MNFILIKLLQGCMWWWTRLTRMEEQCGLEEVLSIAVLLELVKTYMVK